MEENIPRDNEAERTSADTNDPLAHPTSEGPAAFLSRHWFYLLAGVYLLVLLRSLFPDTFDPVVWFLVAVLASCALLYTVWVFPRWQVKHIKGEVHDIFTLENEARKTYAQVLGGILLLASLFVAWQNLKVTQKNAEITQRITQDAQLNDRFRAAIEHVGDKDTSYEKRLVAIYTLGQVARSREDYYRPAMDILTAYVRDPTPSSDGEDQAKTRKTIQAALTAIGWRPKEFSSKETEPLNLSGLDLRGVNLSRANLTNVVLEKSNLSGANLSGVDLSGADLRNVNLWNARLDEADLSGAKLGGAAFSDATSFDGADLRDADLAHSQGLSPQGLKSARTGSQTILPPEVGAKLRDIKQRALFRTPKDQPQSAP